MTSSNVTHSPRSIAVAAAQRLRAMIALSKHDSFIQQTMRSANSVVLRSGMLVADKAEHDAYQSRMKHSGDLPTIH